MLTFHKNYFLLTLLIFFIEIGIALYINDTFIRPYLGDVLVVILLYCFVKTFFKVPVITTALLVLLFSFIVELLQFLNIVKIVGLEHYKIARIVIGTSFSWADLVCYTAGIGIVLLVEKQLSKNRSI